MANEKQNGIISASIYEDAVEYRGNADVTMPDITYLTTTMSGAGIAGNIETVFLGMVDAMSMTINFNNVCREQARLCEPRPHLLDIRVAQQATDGNGEIGVDAVKHVVKAMPKSMKLGKVAAASASDASGEYSVSYLATYINGKLVNEIDPRNFKCVVNGVDYLEEVRRALGK